MAYNRLFDPEKDLLGLERWTLGTRRQARERQRGQPSPCKTIGKIGIVKRYSQLAFSGDLCLRVNPEINSHYLLVALDHSIGQVQFNRWITGSTNGHLAPRDVQRIQVPRFKRGTEDRTAGFVEESLTRRLESEKLLQQAKNRVEQPIEEAVRK
jgi:hypothetical protein